MLVLGGTTEARMLLQRLIDEGEAAVVSTASEFAARFIEEHPLVEHISGRLDARSLRLLIKERSIRAVIDATHPYATQISENAIAACSAAGITYLRLERERDDDRAYERAHYAGSFEEAAELACGLGEVLFLATGSKTAHIFRRAAVQAGRKLYIRVLPDEASVSACRDAGFADGEIITGIGPFTYEDNYGLWKRLGIDVVVTKDSGGAGGFPDKLDAARDLCVDLVVVSRPRSTGNAHSSIDEVVKAAKRAIKVNA